ncbi:MAG: divergent polysaccharide deacetylase family protein [Magnetococcales bacterium]|nr:divergent polysaccharide deacetylase family protein [Magnetococcales bacterium]
MGKGVVPLAVVIDDLGYNREVSLGISRLPGEVTLAVLPGGPSSREVVRVGGRTGKELLLHQPMEPYGYPGVRPGPGALFLGMEEERIRQILVANLVAFPEVVGVNNHMGSRFTSNGRAMDRVMGILKERGLFFLDSRTSQSSVGRARATAAGVPWAVRQVFLDNVANEGAIGRQLTLLEREARHRGGAIGIGHPYRATLRSLERWLPGLRERGLVLVPVSQLLRPESARAHYRGPGKAREEPVARAAVEPTAGDSGAGDDGGDQRWPEKGREGPVAGAATAPVEGGGGTGDDGGVVSGTDVPVTRLEGMPDNGEVSSDSGGS